MQKHSSILRALALPVLSLLALGACADAGAPVSPLGPEGPALRTASYGATLLECPTDVTRSVSATVGLTGGVLELDGHKVSIPAGAVLLPTEFSLTVPASNYMEIDVEAGGQEHFQFEKPISLTISYARCTRANITKSGLRIYYIDGTSKSILADMGGTDDKTARVVTTGTDHLSEYAIGSP